MPIADLLGVQVDMQLLLKLSISVAAVLLVSWAYRFYSARDAEKVQEPNDATGQNRKTTLRRQSLPQHDPGDGGRTPRRSDIDSAAGDLSSDSTEEMPAEAEKSESACVLSPTDKDIIMKGERVGHQKPAEVATGDISFGSALNLPDPAGSGMAAATGRRSPCFLQKLEGRVGVGRELRRDLECPGAYSSFLSKAEIKVEDANVVLEGTGDQIVRGKIYDYYVESFSHCVTDSSSALGQYERSSESQPAEFGSRGGGLAESPSSPSAIIMHDVVLPQSAVEAPSSPEGLEQRHPARPVLLRKESYLSAAEQCELLSTSRASTALSHSLASTSDESVSVHPMISPSTDGKRLNAKEGADLQTEAGVSLLNETGLESKLDLGNSLEMLYLAKKHGHASVQQAALRVMSDNYLHVLRDPGLYGRLMADEREQIRRQRMRGRRFVAVADMDPQDWARNTDAGATETEPRKTSSALYYYDDYKDSWHTLCSIPQEVVSKACAMCTLDNYLFVALGCGGTDREMAPSKRVFCYDPLTSIWKEISPMNEARPRCRLAALEGYIYAIGGECLSSVERYDPRTDRWTFVAPLPNDTFAVAHHVTVSGGELFVSGGTLRCVLLRYSPKTDTWRPSLLAGGKDRTADMVAVGRFLYRFDAHPLLGVSVYRYHTVARLWYECSSRRLPRCPAFRCVAVDNAIYCVSRQFTMRFRADEVSPGFSGEDLSVLPAAKGLLFPFVLSLPDKRPRQTSV